jgi:hypothetical protein
VSAPLLGRAEIEAAFTRLGERLVRRHVVGELYVIGGAAMALAYDAERVTRDIDATFVPHGVVLDAAREVAAELGLPAWWLNDQASAYVSPTPDSGQRAIFNHPGLRVSVISPRHLLAMKVLAARRYADTDDIARLAALLDLTDVESVAAVCAEVFPQEPVSERARAVVADALGITS